MVKAWCSIGLLIILSWMSVSVNAEGDVLSLNTSTLQEMALERIPPWPDEMVLSGTNQHWQKVLHKGRGRGCSLRGNAGCHRYLRALPIR
jgi:hypothetical protein